MGTDTSPTQINVLDYGYVRLLNVSGPTRRPEAAYDADDIDPANVARTSFGQMNSGRTREQNLKLCDYLIRNRHTTPLEMVMVWMEMRLPIFVARQFVRHRTVSINEISGRYVRLPAQWYVPEQVGGRSSTAKQGQEDNLRPETQTWFRQELDHDCAESYRKYEKALGLGVAHEHARLLLHLNHYTRWVWRQDLHNLMHFLSLRDHAHAQVEAQIYAKAITSLLEGVLPGLMNLYRKHSK